MIRKYRVKISVSAIHEVMVEVNDKHEEYELEEEEWEEEADSIALMGMSDDTIIKHGSFWEVIEREEIV